ncbi:MAG TPA: hypothetical protein VG605_17585 [Puia sp.]|nr:hypothetical protein [Puia sp.]
MKTGSISALYVVICSLAIALCFIPFLFLGFKKVRKVNTFRVIGIYWFLNGLVNLPMLGQIRQESLRNFFTQLSTIYDLADAPLMLLIFALAASGRFRKQLLLVMLGLIGAEAVLVAEKGYTYSWPLFIGAGVVLVLAYSVAGLWQYLKKMEHDRFENSMAFVYASLLFAYGTYLIIFLLSLFPKSSQTYNEADSFLMYYISLSLAAVLTSAGIWSYGLRGREPGSLRFSDSPRYSSSSS